MGYKIKENNKLLIFGMNSFFLVLTLTLTSCDSALTKAGSSVGIGNTILFIIMSVVLTLIIRGLGYILGAIPLIGGVLKFLTGIVIVLWWLLLIIGCIIFYGWASIPLAIIVLVIFLFTIGGPNGFILIFF